MNIELGPDDIALIVKKIEDGQESIDFHIPDRPSEENLTATELVMFVTAMRIHEQAFVDECAAWLQEKAKSKEAE